MIRLCIYILILIMSLISCDNEILLEEYESPCPIHFTTICVGLSTKATGTIYTNVLPQYSQISLYSLQHTESQPSTLWNPELFNNEIGTSDADGAIPVTLKDNAANQYDLMHASLLNQSKKSSALVFEFHHLLTQITINIIKNTGVTIDLPLTKIQVVAPQSATLDIWQGQLSDIAGQTTYTLDTNTTLSDGDNPISGQFLLFPQKADEMILTFGNDESNVFHVVLSGEPQIWEAGVNYQYNITINRNIPEIASPEVPADNNATPNEEVNNGGEIPETPTDSTVTEPETKVSDPNPYHIHLSID